MDVLPVVAVTRVIRCDESNAAEFAAMVNDWPELKALVRTLRAVDLFPGLRGMQVTLTGAPEWVSKGVAAVATENASVVTGGVHAA
ncbi:MAG: hypothetical protein ACT6S0_25535 [Roseateles sp.]|uniref:hypothetical protein n=1 Tax=Roseateles sp. TaxID=1971397 RepID=UPI0040372B35